MMCNAKQGLRAVVAKQCRLLPNDAIFPQPYLSMLKLNERWLRKLSFVEIGITLDVHLLDAIDVIIPVL